VQPRQAGRVAPIGLDPVAGPLWDQGGSGHNTVVPARREVTVNAVAARSRLLSFRPSVKRAVAAAAASASRQSARYFDQGTDASLFGRAELSSPHSRVSGAPKAQA
jgi:hypothetical protein